MSVKEYWETVSILSSRPLGLQELWSLYADSWELWQLQLDINKALQQVTSQRAIERSVVSVHIHHLFPERPDRPILQLGLEREEIEFYLIQAAEKARKVALSYRNFLVGCAVWAKKSREGQKNIFVGCNVKIAKDVRTICAEQVAVGAARAAGYDQILAMVVVGEPQEENGFLPKTLHPCGECLRVFQVMPEIYPETVLITITPSSKAQERFLMSDLIHF